MMGISAYVPCYNNAASVGRSLASLQQQSLAVIELFLVDDGSTDGSRAVAEQLGAQVISMGRNAGRGAVRAAAMERAQQDLVLCCDATNHLPEDFLLEASHWFTDPAVAAVYGRIWQVETKCLADRWRGRHLFRMQDAVSIQHNALLSTYGCVLRRNAVMQVGNFDQSLRHSEDAELGRRLLAAGFDVVFDPNLHVISSVTNTVRQVLERYWRWYAGPREEVNLRGYAKQVLYSLKVMAIQDLRDRDLLSVLITLLSPHYQFWKSWLRRRKAGVRSQS
jgi:cellulose synthase/poly-beta-1,6-N-acetylglucosamine synthase-like glycosyltransferase